MNQKTSNFRPRARGFTLIEAAMVTVIIGVGVVAMLQLLAAGSMSNAASTELTTAINLANNVREMTQTVSYDDLYDYHGKQYSPPVDAREQTLSTFSGWSQQVSVRTANPDWLAQPPSIVLPPGSTPMARVTVRVLRNGRFVHESSWIVAEEN